MNRRHAEPKPLAQLARVLLGLEQDITWQQGALRRVVARALDTEQVFQLKLRLDKAVEQRDGVFDVGIGLTGSAKPGTQIDLCAALTQQHVERDAIQGGELLKFFEARAALSWRRG